MSSTVIRVNGKAPAAVEEKIPVLPPPVWVDGNPSLREITDDIAHPLEGRPGKGWWICFGVALAALLNLAGMVTWLIAKGIGIWGLNNSVGWGFAITNFVFWIGIGHAGTLISAILLLFRQQWRTSINRSAEAMTIFAVMCAGIFPGIHVGRPWLVYFIFPYFPNQRGPLWVNFRSPLVWDVFAISTYFTISLVFWYLGMIPDLATLRDRAAGGIKKFIFRVLSVGWNGSHRTWSRYEIVSLVLAGLATPLVLSVHSIVSMDFATSLLPGWHTTIFPPYFVAGAIYSGFGMVLTLLIITRSTMHLERYITVRHLDKMAKVTMLTGMIVSYAYLTEFFAAWYGGNLYERYHFINRATGPYAWCFYLMVLCNVFTPHFMWFKKVRTSAALLFAVSILVNIGMWFERFVIIVVSLHRAFLPSGWGMFYPTIFDIGILIGSFGLFFTCFLLFIRALPMIAMWEIKGVVAHGAHKMALSSDDAEEMVVNA
jgi:molybdopterin-containing oxidoreductase family membrane subunit